MSGPTEVLADGPPRMLGRTDSPLEIVKLPAGAFFQRRYLRMHKRPLYELSPFCETCPPLFRQLDAMSGSERLSIAEFKDRLATGLAELDDDILNVTSAVLPPGEYIPLLLRLWPRLIVPGEPGDYFAEERSEAFEIEVWDHEIQPSSPYYRCTTMHLREGRGLFEFVLPIHPSFLDAERVLHYQTLIREGASPTAIAFSVLDVSSSDDTDLPVCPVHFALGHFLLDGHHKMRAAAELGTPLKLMAVLSTSMGKARPEAVLQLACELAGREWTGSDLLR